MSNASQRQRAQMSLRQKGILLVAVPVVLQTLILVGLMFLRNDADSYAVKAGEARDISTALRQIECVGADLIMHVDAALSSRRPGLNRTRWLSNQLDVWVRHLKGLLPEQSDRRDLLDKLSNRSALLAAYIDPANIQAACDSQEHYLAYIGKTQKLEDELEKILSEVADPHFSSALVDTAQEKGRRRLLLAFAVGGAGLNLIWLFVMGRFFTSDIVKRLAALQDSSTRLLRGQRLDRPTTGTDEIAVLDQSFHKMADTLTETAYRQRALFENARDVLCWTDKTRHFIGANDAVQKVLGHEVKDLLGCRVEEFIGYNERRNAIDAFSRSIHEDYLPPVEMTVRRKNGGSVDTSWLIKYSPEEDAIFCVVRDISERKAAEKLRKEVLQMVNHDLRSPLSTIHVIYSVLKSGVGCSLNEKGEHQLAVANASINRMLRLINDLLDIEKLEAGLLKLECENVDVALVVEQSVQSVFLVAQQKHVQVLTECPHLIAFADKDRLVQILMNLLSNAIKFSPAGSTITVFGRQLGEEIELNVVDEGRGIPQSMKAAIFERFSQVQTSDATVKGGSGLGLAICKALVELHRGRIGVESEEGKGSRFYFTLPGQR